MGFKNIRALAASLDSGRDWFSFIYKSSGPTGFGARRWADMSMGAGTPKYNAYVGSQAVATLLQNSGNDGIYLGPTPPAGQEKFLFGARLTSGVTTLAPSSWKVQDYLMFYPLIDGDSVDQQDMDNPVSLSRYESGDGVRMMLVCTTPGSASGPITVTYTNSEGVSGRTVTAYASFTTVTGCIMSTGGNASSTNALGPYLPLADGDKGVRSVEAVTLGGAVGGFFALVLVKPLTTLVLPENAVACEMTELIHKARLPKIEPGAFLNFIYCPAGAAQNANPLQGMLHFVWG